MPAATAAQVGQHGQAPRRLELAEDGEAHRVEDEDREQVASAPPDGTPHELPLASGGRRTADGNIEAHGAARYRHLIDGVGSRSAQVTTGERRTS